jgi:integrase
MQAQTVLWDSEVKGFGIRRHFTDGRHFLLRYRFGGRQTYRKIGRFGSPWTCETARQEALRLLGLIVTGVNPAQRQGATFAGELPRYLDTKRRTLKPGAFTQMERHLRKLAQPLHSMELAGIDRRAVAQLLSDIERSGPTTRNRLRSSLSAFFAWAVREGLIETNCVAGTGVAEEGPSRDRVLSNAELAEVWRKGNDVVRLLILTGCRRDEIALMRWSEVDFDKSLLVLPPSRVKNGQKHELPLAPSPIEILRSRRNANAAARGNDALVSDRVSWSHLKEMLDRSLVGVAPWRIHDLRRSVATGMGELGILPHIIEAVLNHIRGHKAGVAGIYQRAKYEGPMRDALTKWAQHVEAITSV